MQDRRGDARDLIHALDDITNQEGYKKLGSWATLVLIVIGFVPGVGDAIKNTHQLSVISYQFNAIRRFWLTTNSIEDSSYARSV